MRESTVVNEWREEAAHLARLELLEAQLTTRFGRLSEESLTALRALTDDRLRAISLELLSAKSLAELGL